MKFTIPRNQLVTALATGMATIERSQTLPILAHVLIEADAEKLSIMATDLENDVRTEAAATVNQPGRATVPARKLYDIARNLPEGTDVGLTFEPEKAILKAGRSRYTLPVLPAIEMPALDASALKHGASFQIAERALKRMMQRVAFAAADGDHRPYLNGLLLHILHGEIHVVASNGICLGKATAKLEAAPADETQIIVPLRTARKIIQLLSDSDEKATVCIARTAIRLQTIACQITAKAIDHAYPDYRRLLLAQTETAVTADRDAMKGALARVLIVSDANSKAVRLTVAHDSIGLAAAAGANEAGEESLPATLQGEAFEIGFGADALAEIVNALPAGQITMRFDPDKRNALIGGAEPGGGEYILAKMVI